MSEILHDNFNLADYYNSDRKKLLKKIVPKNIKKKYVSLDKPLPNEKYEYIILDNLIGNLVDIQQTLSTLKKHCTSQSRIVITYYNHLWEPILKFATILGWRRETGEQNWLNNQDIENLLNLAGFEVITHQKRLLLPVKIFLISDFANRWLGNLPLFNLFCLTTYVVARPIYEQRKDLSVSIVIPARNEAGNIEAALMTMPRFGVKQEIIFVEGHSKDNTWAEILRVQKKYKTKFLIKAFQQKGVGKADAVRLGFERAKGDVLMILDADLTVKPKELIKFYEVIASGKGEFVNGSRLVYPMEDQAMRTLNKMGNSLFSYLFTWILGQRFRDTLCGTKVLRKCDYLKIAQNRKFFGDFDPFGDFDLIFGAVKQNLKIIEVPIRYGERKYGSTNINRFRHGLLLFKMTWFSFLKFRAW